MKAHLIALLKGVLPVSVQERLRASRRLYRRLLYKLRRYAGKTSVVTKADLVDGFHELGLVERDTVMVHSSLRSLGHVEGGAKAVVDALLETIGPSGTLVVPTLSFSGDMFTHFQTYDNEHPFNASVTPSRMGRVSESVRQMPGALRSVHPSHSVAAYGPNAAYLTQDHYKDRHAFGKLSPYYRLCERKGKILMLGVELTHMTVLRVFEDLVDDFPFPVYLPQTYQVDVIMPTGKRYRVECLVHNPETSAIRDNNKLEPYFKQYGILRTTTIGDATVKLIDAVRLLPTMQALLDRGITTYTPRS